MNIHRTHKAVNIMTVIFFCLSLTLTLFGCIIYILILTKPDEFEFKTIEQIFRLRMKKDIDTGINITGQELSLTEKMLEYEALSNKSFLQCISYPSVLVGLFMTLMTAAGFKLAKEIQATYTFTLLSFVLTTIAIFSKVYLTFDVVLIKLMKSTLEDYADDMPNNHGWNHLMRSEQCCGAEDYVDFSINEDWPQGIEAFDISSLEIELESPDHYTTYTLPKGCTLTNESFVYCDWMRKEVFKTPLTCCKSLIDVFNGCHQKNIANEKNNNMDISCAKKILSISKEFFGDNVLSEYSFDIMFSLFVLYLAVYCFLLMSLLIQIYLEYEDDLISNYDYNRSPDSFLGELDMDFISKETHEYVNCKVLAKRREKSVIVNAKTQTEDNSMLGKWASQTLLRKRVSRKSMPEIPFSHQAFTMSIDMLSDKASVDSIDAESNAVSLSADCCYGKKTNHDMSKLPGAESQLSIGPKKSKGSNTSVVSVHSEKTVRSTKSTHCEKCL